MSKIDEAFERAKHRLLRLPGCTAVSIGRKVVGGARTDQDAIVLHVARKGDQTDAGTTMPAMIEGFPTDVVEMTYSFKDMSTDPFEKHDPVFGGLSISPLEDIGSYGSIGCFIQADGTVAKVPAGTYLLTNRHVVSVALDENSTNAVVQPGDQSTPVKASTLGAVVSSSAPKHSQYDCAIVGLGTRGFVNEVPNHPLKPGRRRLTGIGQAEIGDHVYKYGATTGHTRGVVEYVNFSYTDRTTRKVVVDNAILVKGVDGKVWCGPGDSGSVVVRYEDDVVVGLNFKAETTSGTDKDGYVKGLAYDISTQVSLFSTVVALA